MRRKRDIWVLTLIGALAGFFAIRAFASNHPELNVGNLLSAQPIEQFFGGKSLQIIEQHLKEKDLLEQAKSDLLKEIHSLEAIINKYEEIAAKKISQGEEIREQLRASRLLAGMIDVQGAGVEIILNDRKRDSILNKDPSFLNYYIVHDSDLLGVVNELRAAGAEAIAINGTRIMGTSRISCGGPTINVGKEQRFAPPFFVHAIGDPDVLVSYFYRDESIYHTLMFWGLEISVKKKDQIEIPRYMGDITFRYAKPMEEGE